MELLKLLLGNFGEVLGRLLGGYLDAGWPFAAMHGVVLYAVYKTWVSKIGTETKALQNWQPGGSKVATVEDIGPIELSGSWKPGRSGAEKGKAARGRKSETTPILDRFIEDSEALGPQGILVPITDYSDRLDSTVDGMLSELHDRINLFLLVGIAGSLFGLFEFAFRAYDALTSPNVGDNDRIRLLGEHLSSSMAKAFPVGFIGLVLTFFFQIIAGFPERRLRASLTDATREALARRKEVSKSQAQVIQETAGAIRTALLPLNDLKLTLTQSIQPVVKEFGTRLDQSLGLVKAQFSEMQRITASLAMAIRSVNAGVISLNKATDSLKGMLQDAPEVLSNTVKLQESQKAVLSDYEKVLEGYVEQAGRLNLAVHTTISNMANLPEDIVRITQAVFEALGKNSLSAWGDSSKEFYELLTHDYEILFDDINGRVDKIQGQVLSVSKELKAVTEGLEKTVEGLSALPASIDTELKATFVRVGTESKNAWVTMSNDFGKDTQKEYVNYLGKIQQQAEEAGGKLKAGAEEFGRVAANWETLLKDPVDKLIKDTRDAISGDLKKLDQALVERYPHISEKIETFNNDLAAMLVQIQSIQDALALWLRDADKAQKKVHDIHDGLVVADLLQNNTEHVKTANNLLKDIHGRIPSSGGGVQGEMAELGRLLREIRNGINTLANRKGFIGRIRDRF